MDPATAQPTDRVTRSLELLRTRHERVSRARQAVLEVLDESGGHLTAEDIVSRIAERAPGVHRATVYRTLSTFSEMRLVRHIHVGGSPAIYHLALDDAGDETHEPAGHGHAQCTNCGRVLDVPADALDRLSDRLLDELGFELDPHHAALLGLCADCRSSR